MFKSSFALWKRINRLVDGRHTPPAMTAVNRLILICLVLGLGGAFIFAHAIRTAPIGVWLIIGLGLVLRVFLWYRRRR